MSAAPKDGPIPFARRSGSKPGYNPQAERAFLGAVYLQPETLPEVADLWLGKVYASDLDEPKHGFLLEALRGVRAQGKTPDGVTVNAWLSEHTQLKAWPDWEVEIQRSCESATRIAEYARIVVENALLRAKRSVGQRLQQDSIDPDEAMYALETLIDRQRALHLPATPGDGSFLPGRLASQIEIRPIDWIWHGRLARRKLTAISGDGGLGKGLLGIYIAARMSRGQSLPGESIRREPVNVVLLTPEDEAADTIVPRLVAAGADLDRIRILDFWRDANGVKHGFTIPRDVARIEEAIAHDHAGMLVIDPIMGCLDAGVKTGIDSEVRAALNPLKDMAERTECAVPFVLHLNKDARSSNALYRTGGSIAFNSLARLTLLVAQHPNDESLRVVMPHKANIGAGNEPPLMFTVGQMEGRDESHAFIRFSHEVCDLTPADLLGANPMTSLKRSKVLAAVREIGTASSAQIGAFLDLAASDAKALAALRKLLTRMVEAGELIREARGLYMVVTPPTHT